MARDENTQHVPTTSMIQLEKPEKLQVLLQREKQDDCLSCRLTGAFAFIGLGAYSYFSGKNQLRRQEAVILKSGSRFGMKSRHVGITGITIAFVGMGLWRLFS